MHLISDNGLYKLKEMFFGFYIRKPQFSKVCERGDVLVRYWHVNCIFAFSVGAVHF